MPLTNRAQHSDFDTRPGQVLATKLFVPRMRSGLVDRRRLIEAIEEGVRGRLTLITSPPGFGKSTLAAQWVESTAHRVAWLSISATDNRTDAFLFGLVSALETIDREIATGTHDYLSNMTTPVMELALSRFVNELSRTSRDIVLVLDDYHLIENPEIHAGMTFLLDNLPPTLRLVVLSRTATPLPLARLRANRDLFEIKAHDLRFTREEAVEFFQGLNQLDLTLRDINTLADKTEGWAVGLHLAAVSLRGHSQERIRSIVDEFGGRSGLVDDYLFEEVFNRAGDETLAFLLRVSMLDRFNRDLCDAVTGSANAVDILRRLERDNLFIQPLDNQRYWYRFHHLFAESLSRRLELWASPEEIACLHARASDWFERNNHLEEAATHAIAGQQWESALRLIEQLGMVDLWNDRLASIFHWFERLPFDVLRTRPFLCYILSWALLRTAQRDAAQAPLSVVTEAWGESADPIERGRLLNLAGFDAIMVWQPERAIAKFSQSLQALPEDEFDQRAAALLGMGIAYGQVGELALAQRCLAACRPLAKERGRLWISVAELQESGWVLARQAKLVEATVLYRRAMKMDDERWSNPILICMIRLADIYREWNTIAAAQELLQRGENIVTATRAVNQLSRLRYVQARVAWSAGDREAAFDLIEAAIDGAIAIGSGYRARTAKALRARFWIDQSRLSLAQGWEAEAELDTHFGPTALQVEEFATLARLRIAEGNPEAAVRILEVSRPKSEVAGRWAEVIEFDVLRAIAYGAMAREEDATAALDQALALGAPEGFTRVFIDEGAAMAPLLHKIAALGNHRDHIVRLLAGSAWQDGGVDATAIVRPPQFSPLSDRELEVLRLVAIGRSNRDIAAQLFISEPTVKKHLSNIIAKLSVNNRTEAVAHARSLGFLRH